MWMRLQAKRADRCVLELEFIACDRREGHGTWVHDLAELIKTGDRVRVTIDLAANDQAGEDLELVLRREQGVA